MNKLLSNFAAPLLAVLAAMAPNELYSATQTWTGGFTGNNMRSASNWANLTIPVVGDDLVFAGTIRPTPNNNNNAAQGVFSSITFDSTATNFTITGGSANALTISNGITNNSVNTQTISNTITLGSSNVTIAALSGNINLLLAVGDAGAGRGMTKTGSGELQVAGSGTYSGNTTVSAGTLRLATNGALRFVIGGSGTNNALVGAGTTVLEGQFSFDLASASTNTNAIWTIVANTLTNSYGTNFLVAGFNGAGGLWTNTTNGVSYVFAQSTGVLSVLGGAPVNNYDSWVSYWTNAVPGFTNTAGAADPDGDSFSNDLEFAFDGNPTVGTPALLTATTAGSNTVFNYVVRKDPPGGVVYQVQATTNLATGPWTNSAVSISNSANQSGINIPADYERKEFTVPVAAREFYRVKATIAP